MSLLDRIRLRRLPPDCRRVASVLTAYLDDELPSPETDVVAAHLAECARCGIDEEVARRVKAQLAGLHRPVDADALDRLRGFADGLVRSAS